MKLLFAGDLAWPAADIMEFGELAALCADAHMVVNLEGGVITAPAEQSQVNNELKFNLYSHPSVIDALARLRVAACGLANNHISDYVGGMEASQALLQAHGIAMFGSRDRPWCELSIDGQQVVLFGACSPLPEPRTGAAGDHALLFAPAAALAQLRQLRQQFPAAKLVAFMHWGYELATFPQPADREWARAAIDAGVDLVIGHHPHLVQGLEPHGKGWIAYSLGNLLLPQVDFRGHKLHYKTPAVCEQLVLGLEHGSLRAHWLRYDPQAQRVAYLGGGAAAEDAELRRRTPFLGMSDADYRRWFASEGRFGTAGKLASTVFWSYRGWRRLDSALKLNLLGAKAGLRKLAIRSGLHKPYNW
ncbi:MULTISPECIES: CapA family protein [unclassified Duganella]|uniref:CapA family protein n=1 Tax=unclassified Duganella TaxID=2636909 RepID=UPI000E3501D4|nr:MULTISPECIES: CapA family protein [unclassified Duganella]RFP09620.1 CapA family protein [Duganella sp. BJB475]RFP27740.1 CapA family protein [Duganella sp. BJB476]